MVQGVDRVIDLYKTDNRMLDRCLYKQTIVDGCGFRLGSRQHKGAIHHAATLGNVHWTLISRAGLDGRGELTGPADGFSWIQ